LTLDVLCDTFIKARGGTKKMAIKSTERKPLFGNLKSHSNRKTKHTQNLNMQKIKVDGKTVVTTAREAKKIKNSI
jgi:ribosomal protein L28